MTLSRLLAGVAFLGLAAHPAMAEPGYLRDPDIAGTSLVFDDEQSVWSAPLAGGRANRLTAPLGVDPHPIISPDGRQVAFLANFDGPEEIYTMPVGGGSPRRITFENRNVMPIGWDRKAGILYSTTPETDPGFGRIVASIQPANGTKRIYPLAEANDVALGQNGEWLYFVRFGLSISHDHLRRYRGGAMAQLWRYRIRGGEEAERIGPQDANLRRPMLWRDRIIVVSDKGGRDNLWSFALDGTDGHALTDHEDFGVGHAALSGDTVVYQCGADLYRYDLAHDAGSRIALDIASDHPARRPQWLDDPFRFLTDTALSPDGRQVAMTLRGHVILGAPNGRRLVQLAQAGNARLRHARLSPDGRTVYAFSDKGGESELWAFPAIGGGESRQITHGLGGQPTGLWVAPDGKTLAHTDRLGRLRLLDLASGKDRTIDDARLDGQAEYDSLVWSRDGRALVFVRARGESVRRQLALYDLTDHSTRWITSSNYDSFGPAFSPDGHMLWFLSDRAFTLANGSPWGDRNPAPVYDRRTGVFALTLQKGTRFPFLSPTELDPAPHAARPPAMPTPGKTAPDATGTASPLPPIEAEGLARRLYQVPVPAGRYRKIAASAKRLYLLASSDAHPSDDTENMVLSRIAIGNERAAAELLEGHLADHLRDIAMTPDGATLMLVSGAKKQRPRIRLIADGDDLGDETPKGDGHRKTQNEIGLKDFRLRIDPGAEWQDLFMDAWRLHRDHFYDPALHSVEWTAIRDRYRPLLARVQDRSDLDDLMGQMMGELNALHSQIRPAETPGRPAGSLIASLGAILVRQPGGYLIDRILEGDPDLPEDRSPLAAPEVDAAPGDLIVSINGRPLAEQPDLSTLLADQAGRQVLLTLKRQNRKIETVVIAIDGKKEASLRQRAWENDRADRVARLGKGRLGYLHLRAMGPDDMARFTRQFFAQIDKDGLVIDVRRNKGGNIDSWILSELLRKVWMFWSDHGQAPQGNMQQSFRGHIVVLCDAFTYSDGETFAQGVKTLRIGKLIGMRTAGAGVWLSDSDRLADNGLPRTAERPYFDLNGHWLVENHGVEPDIEVENLPNATFTGKDAQLDTAIEVLQQELAAHPVPPLAPEAFTDSPEAIPH
ncbi:S41 family peptidase [Swaminathania salitolerans]|uniref:Tricorn protease homolog n=1 Tax=Swaminathania salitolerans TaxID=182838 RepID=A0A511BLM7_9PROT|nr:S41 family peptidase [Swaminathania salitolerans]GBQ10266.1 Tricorn protease-like protein [Swaminathania salitolerans LMG 21291]GEL01231.1 tricorn protease [Swaminathania salitolerans]